MRGFVCPEGRLRLWRSRFIPAVVAATLVCGVCLGAGTPAPMSAHARMDRWRKVTAWEGSFRATYKQQSTAGGILTTYHKMTDGHVVLDKVTGTETLPGDKNVEGWRGVTSWEGTARAHVTIRTEGTLTANGKIIERTIKEGDGMTEGPARLGVRAVKNVYDGDVDSLKIDVMGTRTQYLPPPFGTKTTAIKDRDWIAIDSRVAGVSEQDLKAWSGRKPSGASTENPLDGSLPDTGLTIRGSYHNHAVINLGDMHKDEWLQVDWAYWPSDEVDLVVDIDGYDEWLPEGNVADWTQPGNHLTIKATLETKDGKPSAKRKASKFIFQLAQVSQEPGICLNFPLYPTLIPHPNEANDLFFDPRRHPPNATVLDQDASGAPGGRRADLPGGNTATAVLSSRDFGGYGILRVTALMEGASSELPGELRGEPGRIDLMIPHSTDDSIVALQWKQAKHVANLTDDRDNETVPGLEHPGDGLSLYEEYRGFVARGKHARTDPRRKTVFVHTKVPHVDGGLRRLEAASGLQVLRIDETEYRDNSARLVNFHHGANHVVDQHGLWIAQSNTVQENAGAQSPYGPPRYVDQVEIGRGHAAWSRDYRDYVIAHELCHALCVPHHGGSFRWQRFARGEHRLSALGAVDMFIATQGGEHSGNEACLTRYQWAHLIERTPGDPGSLVDYGSSEPYGTTLCYTGKGTGVNAPGHQSYPKCGDASEGRGACMSKITVSDVYPEFRP